MTAAQANELTFYLMGEHAAVMQSRSVANLPCQQKIWGIAQQLRIAGNYLGIVPGMNNLTVIFDPKKTSGEQVLAVLESMWASVDAQDFTSRIVRIPVRYGGQFGPDLEHVAEHAGLTPEQVIAAHTAAEYVVYFLGFQPGFAYLGGLPVSLATPRRAAPRLSVPVGSVGIGGAQTGIYPAVSPGGWQLIGRTTLTLFNPTLATPTLLQPGDVIRFVAVEELTDD